MPTYRRRLSEAESARMVERVLLQKIMRNPDVTLLEIQREFNQHGVTNTQITNAIESLKVQGLIDETP